MRTLGSLAQSSLACGWWPWDENAEDVMEMK